MILIDDAIIFTTCGYLIAKLPKSKSSKSNVVRYNGGRK